MSEGLIRIPGNKDAIYRIREEVDSGNPVDWAVEDPYDLAGLLKLYLLKLPESLVPYDIYMELKEVSMYLKFEPELTPQTETIQSNK